MSTFNPSEEVISLFQCKNSVFNFKNYYNCQNANDDHPDMSLFKTFLNQVNSAKTISDLEKIMENVFLKYLAFEWLIGSFDHFLVYGHNFD